MHFSLTPHSGHSALPVERKFGALLSTCCRRFGWVRELKPRAPLHAAVLTPESRLRVAGAAVRLTWAEDMRAVHFLFTSGSGSDGRGGAQQRRRRHQVVDAVHIPGAFPLSAKLLQMTFQNMEEWATLLCCQLHHRKQMMINAPSRAGVRATKAAVFTCWQNTHRQGLCFHM